jgi:hypothetical protein
MRILKILAAVLTVSSVLTAQKHKNQEPFPTEVVVGRDSFFDFGPPFNYYDLTFLRSDGERTNVERVSLTPPADTCYPHAEIETGHVSLSESLPSILQGTNPCLIPEKRLKAELKRRKKGRMSVFSGMNVAIQVQCGDRTRIIRADILDRDIFGDRSRTPQYTSWSRTLFERLDEATGESPWTKPVFLVATNEPAQLSEPASAALQSISQGKFDKIFGKDSDYPSELYRSAQNVPRQPLIELTKSDPVRPAVYVNPAYPPLAKMARVHGTVEFHLLIGTNGSAENIAIDSGPKMLWQAVTDASAKWKFSQEDSGKTVQGSVRFGLNCDAKAN